MDEDTYPYAEKHQTVALVRTLEQLTDRDPDQEVQGIALPVLDASIETVRAVLPGNPIVEAVRGIVSPEQIASGEPIRAADALLVARQLDRCDRPGAGQHLHRLGYEVTATTSLGFDRRR